MLNARSLMNKLDMFKLTVHKYNPDIIGITESWCTSVISDAELQLTDYDLFRCDRKSDNRGGGVLLYVKSELKPIEVQLTSSFVDYTCCKVGNLTIVTCYRSTNSAVVGQDNNANLCHLVRVIRNRHFLMLGDFNYPEINWLNQSLADNASLDCKDFFQVSTIPSLLNTFWCQLEVMLRWT